MMKKLAVFLTVMMIVLGAVSCGFTEMVEEEGEPVHFITDVPQPSENAATEEDGFSEPEGMAMEEPFREILLGNDPFFSVDYQKNLDINSLNEFFLSDASTVVASKVAIVDLDHDGANEIVLWLTTETDSQAGYLILHEMEGATYGYFLPYRWLSELKSNGSYSYGFSAWDYGAVAQTHFDADGYTWEHLFCCTSDATLEYVVDGASTTEDAFLVAMEEQRQLPDALWYDIDPSLDISATQPSQSHEQYYTDLNLDNIGKTLSELKNETTEGEFLVSLGGFPDSAAACYGEQGAEYMYYFFGGKSGDFEKAMDECDTQLKCSGFITTANILFLKMEDDMSFQDFFTLIGVNDYEYFGEETATAKGWLKFTYNGMSVMLNTNEATTGGGWDFTGTEIVMRNAPVSIASPQIVSFNQDLADAVMFH